MTKTNARKQPGNQARYSFIKMVTGTDLSKRRIPKMETDSGVSGPNVWLTGCIHGDEIGGTVLIQEVFKKLKKLLRKGCVKAFPIVNPFGFEQASRLLPFSREDLNRLFPGKENGSLGERIVHTVYQNIITDSPDLVLDLHNDWIRSIPYTLLDHSFMDIADRGFKKKMYTYAEKLGFPVVLDNVPIPGSLSGTLLNKGIPSMTLEVGESFSVNESMTERGVEAVLSLLHHLGMLDESYSQEVQEVVDPGLYLYDQKPLSSTSGIIRFHTREGTAVKKGQLIAKVYNAFGKHQETLYALDDGLVLGRTDHSLSFPGFPIMAFGIKYSGTLY